MCVGSGCKMYKQPQLWHPASSLLWHPHPLFPPPSPVALSSCSRALLMCWKTEGTPKKAGPFLCVLVLLEVIKKGFALGGLGLLSLHLIYHREPVWWEPCCCNKKTTNSRCTQHPQNLCQGGNWSPSCTYTFMPACYFSVLLASFVLSCYWICRFTQHLPEITCQRNSLGGAFPCCPWIFCWLHFSFCRWRCSICLCIGIE